MKRRRDGQPLLMTVTNPVSHRDNDECAISRKTADYCPARTESEQTLECLVMKKENVYHLLHDSQDSVSYVNNSFTSQQLKL